MGGMLDHDYTMALSFAPRLSEVDILPIPEDNKTSVAHARPAWETESGRHTIFINTNHADALQRCKKVVDTIPGAREIFAGQLQMRPEDITPEQLLRLAVLHEMGHAVDFMNFEADPKALTERDVRHKAVLPVANLAVSALIERAADTSVWGEYFMSGNRGSAGVETNDELFALQHEAYRGMPGEQAADGFAAMVWQYGEEHLAQLNVQARAA